MSIVAILVMHHYTFNEKYQSEELSPNDKTYSDITEANIDNCSSLDGKSFREKKNFKSSLTQSQRGSDSDSNKMTKNDPKKYRNSDADGVTRKDIDTFAYQSVDKFDIDKTFNTATSFSDTEKNLQRLY